MSITDDSNLIAVGAYADSSQGRTYLYRHNGTEWELEDTLVATGIDNGDRFGISVSLNANGDRLAVGASRDDGPSNAISNQGAVYLFDYDNSAWTQTQVLRATVPGASDAYGVGVALSPSGDQVMTVGYSKQAAYFYEITDADVNTWQSTETYIASPSSTNDMFGTAQNIAFNGKEAVVGAYYDDSEFQGVVANSDHDTDFDSNDLTSTGTTFDSSARSSSNSGAAYVIAYQAYALDQGASLQARVDAINAILAWAAGGSTAPTALQYETANVTDVNANNLTDVNTQLQTLAHTDMANVQPMVTSINTILAYTTDGTNSAPTETDYTLAGISGVNADNVDTLNGYVGGDSVAMAALPALVTKVDHLLVLINYSADQTNTEPILTNFTGAGVSTSREINLADYNTELVNQTLDSEVEFQALVDAINALDDYADGTTTTAPSITTYHTAGFDELSALNVQVINTALINNTLVTLADMQTSISALNTLTSYALDNTSTAPSTDDYTNAGVTSVGNNILDYLNSHLGKEKREGFTHYLKASNAHGSDYFGWVTSISDDGATLAVLAQDAPTTSSTTDDGGAVYMYRRNGDTWTEVAILRSEQTSNHAYDMAMTPDGQRVVMLAHTNAFIFDVPMIDNQPDWDSTWTRTTYNHGETTSAGLFLALSEDGTTMAVSDGNYSSNSGRIRIHQEVNGTWTYRQQHVGTSGTYFGEHGIAINGDGSVIAVGAYSESTQRGYVDIYRQATDTTWTRTRNNLGASNGESNDYFGWSVSLNRAGNRLAVGAKYEDGATNSISAQGAVYLFDYDGSAWNETQILRASDAASGDDFGERVVLTGSGDQLAVSTQDAEAVYTYDLSSADSTTWQGTESIFSSPSARADEFGTWGLTFNGTEVVVGAYVDDSGYTGVVTNTDANTLFDENDASSTGTAFDNTDTSITNSGAVYVMTNAPYALAGLEYVQARVDGSNSILAWAAGGATPPSVEEYAAANVTDVNADNLSDVNAQLQILAHTDMADVQPMVTAINKILAYTTDTTNPIPTNGDYTLAGISGVNADN
ncbi:hypothetical protein UB34_19865, partial [Photobacterium leiognathi]|uniref:FG-GAP repeat protein n=1 Tax=Photobacterium leiognathi TaxID=553611 RepID=UPI0005D3CE9C